MIGTLINAKLKILIRDRVSLALIFILPVVFFSIFAGIFGGGGKRRRGTPGGTKWHGRGKRILGDPLASGQPSRRESRRNHPYVF